MCASLTLHAPGSLAGHDVGPHVSHLHAGQKRRLVVVRLCCTAASPLASSSVPWLLDKAEALIGVPRSHFELPQVGCCARRRARLNCFSAHAFLFYADDRGQFYAPHFDGVEPTTPTGRLFLQNGGQRVRQSIIPSFNHATITRPSSSAGGDAADLSEHPGRRARPHRVPRFEPGARPSQRRACLALTRRTRPFLAPPILPVFDGLDLSCVP